MKNFRSSYLRRVLVPVMAVSLASACTYWQPQKTAPSQVISEKQPGLIRLTLLDGEKIRLAEPSISEDCLVGHPVRYIGGARTIVRSDTLRVATDSLAHLEILRPSPGATLVGVLMFLGVVTVLLITVPDWDLGWGGD